MPDNTTTGKIHTYTSPVKPGDPLWWASTFANDGPGPVLAEPRLQEDAVEAIQFDGDGMRIVTDQGEADLPNTEFTCLTKQACLDWIAENRPDTILMDGRTVKAIHVNNDGEQSIIDLVCGEESIDRIMDEAGLSSSEPDDEGHFALFDRSATKENTPFLTFIRDSRGQPVDVIYGPYLLVRCTTDPKTGRRVLTDVSQDVQDAVTGRAANTDDYDPAYWTCCDRMTVAMAKDFLKKFPDDAILHCCGTVPIYWHYCPGTKAVSIDCDSLSDLPEYEDREPAHLKGLAD